MSVLVNRKKADQSTRIDSYLGFIDKSLDAAFSSSEKAVPARPGSNTLSPELPKDCSEESLGNFFHLARALATRI